MGLPTPWVRHLKEQDRKDKFEQAVRASITALSRLYDLMEEKERDLLTEETKTEDFDSPSWAYKQAYRNGQKTQIRDLKKLLEFIKG